MFYYFFVIWTADPKTMSAPNRSNPENRPMLVNPCIWEANLRISSDFQGNPGYRPMLNNHPERRVSSLAIRMCFRTPRNTRLESPELKIIITTCFRKIHRSVKIDRGWDPPPQPIKFRKIILDYNFETNECKFMSPV